MRRLLAVYVPHHLNNASLHLAPKILISLASCPMEKEDLKTPNME
jgi:hypothetical protein